MYSYELTLTQRTSIRHVSGHITRPQHSRRSLISYMVLKCSQSEMPDMFIGASEGTDSFGIREVQDIFQEKMDQILEQCPGMIGIANDIVVYGKTEAEHDKALHNLMAVGREYGLVFNADKCDVKTPQVKFFGCLYDKEGVHPDPAKIADSVFQCQAA